MNIEKYTRYLIQTMKDNGVNCLSAEFEGCGDSGEITEIVLHPSNAKIDKHDFTKKSKEIEITATVISFTGRQYNFAENCFTSSKIKFEEETLSLYDFFEKYVEYLAHRDEVDWWNNGGGKGELYINIKEDRFEFSIETYETETPVYSEGSIQDWLDEIEDNED